MKIVVKPKGLSSPCSGLDSVLAVIRLNIKETAMREGIENPNVLAALSGLPYETCRKLWHGRATRIDLNTIEKLCDTLRVRPGQLFDYEYEPDKPKGQSRRVSRRK